MAGGRPCEYTQEIADRICEQLAYGKSLRTVCKPDDMPCVATIFNWMRTQPKFLEQYTRAKEESADALVEEMMDIADDGSNDWMEQLDAEGKAKGWRENGEAIQRSRLRVDTRKWVASKLKAKKYGEKMAVTGEDGGPLQVMINDPTRRKPA
jgi:hypothetical protein